MIGLKRNTVKLEMHQLEWDVKAAETITMLKEVLGSVAVDIQHIGSTYIQTIHAKPILDLVIGVNDLEDIKACIPALAEKQVIFRGQDHPEQLLFAMGDFGQHGRRAECGHLCDYQPVFGWLGCRLWRPPYRGRRAGTQRNYGSAEISENHPAGRCATDCGA